jgi:bifunctional DNA-binding transcriptional regulator/antitoxin component of YhaV-PrlF toxin-antitoxin module
MHRVLDRRVISIGGCKGIVIPKETADKLGISFGDVVQITIEK